MKKTWIILSDMLHRKAINSLPDTMTVQGRDCSDRKVKEIKPRENLEITLSDPLQPGFFFFFFLNVVGERNRHTNSQRECHFCDCLTHKADNNFIFQ